MVCARHVRLREIRLADLCLEHKLNDVFHWGNEGTDDAV